MNIAITEVLAISWPAPLVSSLIYTFKTFPYFVQPNWQNINFEH